MSGDRNPDGTFAKGCTIGQTANPEGINGHTPITDSLRVLLTREDDTYGDKPMNNAQKIALQWAKKAKAGELGAITTLAERVEGKAEQPVKHSGSVTLETLVTGSYDSSAKQD